MNRSPRALTPPPAVLDAAERAAVLGNGSTTPVSLAAVEVHHALLGRTPLAPEHLATMADHPYPPDSLNGQLLGGAAGRRWAQRLHQVTAAARRPRDLGEFSLELNAVNHRFRDRVEQVLAQAMRQALAGADRKVNSRAHRRQVTASAARAAADALAVRCYPAEVLAAIHTTTDELLHDRFSGTADQVAVLFDRRQRERRRLLARTFPDDLDESELETRWGPTEDRRRDALVAFVVAAMFADASRRLSQPRDVPIFDARGEQPTDPYLSPRVAADVSRIADGATLAPGTGSTTAPSAPGGTATGRGIPAGPAEAIPEVPVVPAPVNAPGADVTAEGGPLFDYTDQLVSDVVDMVVPGSTVTYVWTVGAPARPFEPHQELAGMEATNETFWLVFSKDPDEFPEGAEAWFPGDHDGCQCDLDVFYAEPDA